MALVQADEDRVGDVADARLDGGEAFGEAAGPHFAIEEVEEVLGDPAMDFLGGFEGGIAVGVVGLDDGDDLVEVELPVFGAVAVTGGEDGDRLALAVAGTDRDDVVHPLKAFILIGVDLEDDLFGGFEIDVVVSAGGGGDGGAVGVDAGDLDQGEVDFAVMAVADERSGVAEVHVLVFDVAGVDLLAGGRVALVGEAEALGVGTAHGAIVLRAGGSAGEDVEPEGFALGTLLAGAIGEGGGNGLGVASAGEAGHADDSAVGDQGGGRLGRDDLALQLAGSEHDYSWKGSTCANGH